MGKCAREVSKVPSLAEWKGLIAVFEEGGWLRTEVN